MVEVDWTVSDNAPFYDATKLNHSVFSDAQEVTEWFEEMYGSYDGFIVVNIRRG